MAEMDGKRPEVIDAAPAQHAVDDDVGAKQGAASGNSQIAQRAAKVRAQRAAARRDPGAAAATDAIASKGAGEPLPEAAARKFGTAYGQDLSDVRIHLDGKAAAAAAEAGADAFTYGKDIFFAAGKYDPASPQGSFVLGHELAHVVQQGGSTPQMQAKSSSGDAGGGAERDADQSAHTALETGHASDAQEHEASHAADSALVGGRTSLGRAAPRVRFFAQGDGSKARGGHAYMTEQALAGMGIDDTAKFDQNGDETQHADTRVARMGNWERDLSQVLTPTTAKYANDIMPLLNLVALKDFGRGINAESFGTYDPVEHIDNPTGLRGTDVLAQGPMIGSEANAWQNPDNANTIGGASPSVGNAGGHDQAYADVDARYRGANGHAQNGATINPHDATAFQVDQSGIPRYIYASKQWATQTLRNAARLGREQKAQGDERLHGPRMFASGTHTLQDYFAHSNFLEVGINILIRQGGLKIDDGTRKGDGSDHLVDAAQAAPGRVLNSQAHANDAGGDPLAGNLAVGDPAQGAKSGGDGNREVVTTGSFNLTDTVDSLLEEVGDHWKLLDPFKKKEDKPSALTLACLDYMEMDKKNPTDFSGLGNSIAGLFHTLSVDLQAVVSAGTGGVGAAVQGGGRIAAGAVTLGADAAGGAMQLGGSALKKSGGASEWLSQHSGHGAISSFFHREAGSLATDGARVSGEGDAIAKSGGNEASKINSAAGKDADALRASQGGLGGVIAKLGDLEKSFRGRQHTARELYTMAYSHGPLDELQAAVRPVPVVGPPTASKIHSLQQEMHRLIDGALATAWNTVLDAGVAALNKVVATVREKTNIQTKKAPVAQGKMHGLRATLAEKFGNVSDLYDQSTGRPKTGADGTHNGIAPGSYTPPSHTEVAKDHGDIENQGAQTVTKGEAAAATERGNWLSPLAQLIAAKATVAVGVPVAACWDAVDKGEMISDQDPRLLAIDAAVDLYFRHPQDATFWRADVLSWISTKQLGPQLLEHLRTATGGAPAAPSHVAEIPANHPVNGSR